VNIEYRIDPARSAEFLQLMQESRRSRMSHGALDWQLLQDLYDPGRVVEQITDVSWTEHLRPLRTGSRRPMCNCAIAGWRSTSANRRGGHAVRGRAARKVSSSPLRFSRRLRQEARRGGYQGIP